MSPNRTPWAGHGGEARARGLSCRSPHAEPPGPTMPRQRPRLRLALLLVGIALLSFATVLAIRSLPLRQARSIEARRAPPLQPVELEPLREALAAQPELPLDLEHTDVLVMMVCTFRRDRLQPYGQSRPTTPFLQELAERGVLFEHAIVQSPWTRPRSSSSTIPPRASSRTAPWPRDSSPSPSASGPSATAPSGPRATPTSRAPTASTRASTPTTSPSPSGATPGAPHPAARRSTPSSWPNWTPHRRIAASTCRASTSTPTHRAPPPPWPCGPSAEARAARAAC